MKLGKVKQALYCPLRYSSKDGHGTCLKEKCAWWDDFSECCALKKMAQALHSLAVDMEDIKLKV